METLRQIVNSKRLNLAHIQRRCLAYTCLTQASRKNFLQNLILFVKHTIKRGATLSVQRPSSHMYRADFVSVHPKPLSNTHFYAAYIQHRYNKFSTWIYHLVFRHDLLTVLKITLYCFTGSNFYHVRYHNLLRAYSWTQCSTCFIIKCAPQCLTMLLCLHFVKSIRIQLTLRKIAITTCT